MPEPHCDTVVRSARGGGQQSSYGTAGSSNRGDCAPRTCRHLTPSGPIWLILMRMLSDFDPSLFFATTRRRGGVRLTNTPTLLLLKQCVVLFAFLRAGLALRWVLRKGRGGTRPTPARCGVEEGGGGARWLLVGAGCMTSVYLRSKLYHTRM